MPAISPTFFTVFPRALTDDVEEGVGGAGALVEAAGAGGLGAKVVAFLGAVLVAGVRATTDESGN